ncbi:MAG TPA: hypothetical protein P5013_02275 [Methanoregula sp.]|nr:hypothetical protein [Methanoregula sp.]
MKVIRADRHQENGRTIVNLNFKTMDQLLDPDDLGPLPEKELTTEAEEAILRNVFAGTLSSPLTLGIQAPGVPDAGQKTGIPDAIRHHFRVLLTEHDRDWAIFLRERRTALAFTGFNILVALVYLAYSVEHADWMASVPGQAIGGIIIIFNWATIWDTYEFFIFDGREKRQRRKLLQKIIDAEIRVVPPVQDR